MEESSKKIPSLARNWISFVGITIAAIAAINIGFLVFADLGAEHANPYVGIMAYIVVPGILLLGLGVLILGMVLERRRRRRSAPDEVPRYPDIDLNNPGTRKAFVIAMVALTIFIMVSMVGSYQAYHYMDSDAFCGTACHAVMQPEYTAYQASPHARVGCVNCHIGSGATWYVKSKMSGAHQLYAMVAKKYPKPIPTPVENLRPAQETCERCHWPEKFWGTQLKVFNHFGYDEANTPRETRMLIKTGGGSPSTGLTTGIHWHMNIENETTYAAADGQRQQIPWVRLRNRRTGQTTEYKLENAEMTDAQIAAAPKRTMDCVDCHNRPTHIYEPPDRAVDKAMLANHVSRTLPYMKQQAVAVLTKDYNTTAEAIATIDNDIRAYYAAEYPDLATSRKGELDRSIHHLQQIFRTIRFPEMKTDWRTHPNNIGHLYSIGCFRCHDDQHVSRDGKRLSKECSLCHDVLGQKEAGVMMVEAPEADFQHPVDLGDLRAMNCADCHTGSGM